jgi:hypothetical protein
MANPQAGRVHAKLRATWRPISTMRWRKYLDRFGETRSGTRYFLFGTIPITTIWDRSEGSI